VNDGEWLAELAERHLGGSVVVEHEPGVYIVHWNDRQLPVPEYQVAQRHGADLGAGFRRFLKSLEPTVERETVPESERCGARVECGGTCCLRVRHAGHCECGADEPGRPGSCPA
jgi:hypothetical protein